MQSAVFEKSRFQERTSGGAGEAQARRKCRKSNRDRPVSWSDLEVPANSSFISLSIHIDFRYFLELCQRSHLPFVCPYVWYQNKMELYGPGIWKTHETCYTMCRTGWTWVVCRKLKKIHFGPKLIFFHCKTQLLYQKCFILNTYTDLLSSAKEQQKRTIFGPS